MKSVDCSRSVTVQVVDTTAFVVIKSPPVNALSSHVREGLIQAVRVVDEAHAKGSVQEGVLMCDGRTFVAGADIRELQTLGQALKQQSSSAPSSSSSSSSALKSEDDPLFADGSSLSAVCVALEQSNVPFIAAVHGAALGGGLELALCCDIRLAMDARTQFNLPEVHLGLLPGAGGTQRLPRVIPLERALQCIVFGKALRAAEAQSLGLVCDVLSSSSSTLEQRQAAVTAWIRQQKQKQGSALLRKALVRNKDVMMLSEAEAHKVCDAYRQRCQRGGPLKGFHAPLRCIDAVAAAVQHRTPVSFDAGLAREQELFLEAAVDPQSMAQQYQFFAERAAQKAVTVKPHGSVGQVVVIGGGTMGVGIALCFAVFAKLPVVLVERDEKQREIAAGRLGKEMKRMGRRFARDVQDAVKHQRITTSADLESTLVSLAGGPPTSSRSSNNHMTSPSTSIPHTSPRLLVVEAVFEDLALKCSIFERLSRLCRGDTILASNTSTLDIDAMAAVCHREEHRQNVIGMHFFAPANVMRLVEVVRGSQTSDECVASVMALVKRIRKVGVVVGCCDGFVGNRMMMAQGNAVEKLLLQGCPVSAIDSAMESFGFRMGPLAVGDLSGLDVGFRIRREQRRRLPAAMRDVQLPKTVADVLCDSHQRFGQKSGAGFYKYDIKTTSSGAKRAVRVADDAFVAKICADLAASRNITQQPAASFTASAIVETLMSALVDEGRLILREGIARSESDIDVIWCNGYGFPAFEGGPMYWGKTKASTSRPARRRGRRGRRRAKL